MAGLKVTLPTTFTDVTLPVIHDDSILTAGSLILVDPIHTANPWAVGVPADAASIPNIAWKECAAAIGSGTIATLACTANVKGAINNGTKGKVERSAKGGLHGIVSLATALASGDGVNLSMATLINTYLLANTGHSYYFSAWDRLTRINPTYTTPPNKFYAEYELGRGNTGAALFQINDGPSFGFTTGATSTSYFPSSQDISAGGLGNRRISAASIPGAGLAAASMFFGPSWGAPPSSYNAAVLGSRNNCGASFLFYRCYLEDLTVSGRSFATVDALDSARFALDVNTVGGRYYGDTFTAPSTIA